LIQHRDVRFSISQIEGRLGSPVFVVEPTGFTHFACSNVHKA